MKSSTSIRSRSLILALATVVAWLPTLLYAQGPFDEADGYRNQNIVTMIDYRIVATHDQSATTVALRIHINPEVLALGTLPASVVVILTEESLWTPLEARNRFEAASNVGELSVPAPQHVYDVGSQYFQNATSNTGLNLMNAIESLSDNSAQQLWANTLDHLENYYLQQASLEGPRTMTPALAGVLSFAFTNAYADADGNFDATEIIFQAGIGLIGGATVGAVVTGPAGGLGAGPMALAGGVGGAVKATCEETWDVVGPPVEEYADSVWDDVCSAIDSWFCRLKNRAYMNMNPANRWQ